MCPEVPRKMLTDPIRCHVEEPEEEFTDEDYDQLGCDMLDVDEGDTTLYRTTRSRSQVNLARGLRLLGLIFLLHRYVGFTSLELVTTSHMCVVPSQYLVTRNLNVACIDNHLLLHVPCSNNLVISFLLLLVQCIEAWKIFKDGDRPGIRKGFKE